MLQLAIPPSNYWNEELEEFVTTKGAVLQLEHSLISLSKWESKWKKPFLVAKPHTEEETIDYIRCMTLTQNVDPLVYYALRNEHIDQVSAYIDDPMTATTIQDRKPGRNRPEVVTSELIYYWMVAHQIPFECQKWHLNRLLILIRVCNIKNAPPEKMGRRETLAHNRQLNASRLAARGTRG